jgi:hypothetical protein
VESDTVAVEALQVVYGRIGMLGMADKLNIGSGTVQRIAGEIHA